MCNSVSTRFRLRTAPTTHPSMDRRVLGVIQVALADAKKYNDAELQRAIDWTIERKRSIERHIQRPRQEVEEQ